MKDIVNNAKSDVYAPEGKGDLAPAFNYGKDKCQGSTANSGYPGKSDRQDNGPINQPRPSEMKRRR